MATPIVKVRHRQNVQSFYTLTEYKLWKDSTVNIHLWDIKYYKGLGTSTSSEAKEYFNQLGNSIVNYVYQGDISDEAINLAFNKALTDNRKDWLRKYDSQLIIEQTEKKIPIEDFVNRDLIHFSNYNNERAIPSICDGLKPSQRKVLFSVLKRNLTKEIKVAQLSGYVSEHSAYHHGEMSLNETIIGMAHDFVGSNNINLLIPKGQFGTRIQGGKDSASPRYIYTLMNDLTTHIFNPQDNALLQYQEEDSMKIDPIWYMPILPMILVNGCNGVGTGFSTQIPSYNPIDIVHNILRLIRGESIERMMPWFRGFRGTVFEKDGKIYSKGIYQITGPNTVEVLELPIGLWTENYKVYLEELVIDKSAEEKKKKNQCLAGFESHFTESTVKFILHLLNE
jgi:DNA topoisomerase-2